MQREEYDRETCLFVGGLPSTTTVESLVNYFEQFNVVIRGIDLKKTKLKKERGLKVCKGYGYLKLDSRESAYILLSHDHEFQNRILDLEFAYSKQDKKEQSFQNRLKKVHVNNLAPHTSDQRLTDFLSNFGRVNKAYRIKDHKSQQEKPYGYALFENDAAAKKVIALSKSGLLELDGHLLAVSFYMSKGRIFQEHRALIMKDETEKPVIISASQPSAHKHHRGSLYGESLDHEIVPNALEINPLNVVFKRSFGNKDFQRSGSKRKVFTESRESSIYLQDMHSFSPSKSPPPIRIRSESPQTKNLKSMIKRNETKAVIDVIVKKTDCSDKLDHGGANLLFRIKNQASRRINEIPANRSEDQGILRLPLGPMSLKDFIVNEKNPNTGKESNPRRHRDVDPLAGLSQPAKRPSGLRDSYEYSDD